MASVKFSCTIMAIGAVLAAFTNQNIGLTQAEFLGENNELGCKVGLVDNLGPECRPFVVYNQLEWSNMTTDEALNLARHCACQLVNLDWELAYDQHPSVHRVLSMVRGVLAKHRQPSGSLEDRDAAAASSLGDATEDESQYPAQLWSDTDTIVRGYSIFLSIQDYFVKLRQDENWSWLKKADFKREPHLKDIRYVCFQVAQDRLGYYQYLENLQRINSLMFFQALHMNDAIDLIYQASKACKLFLLPRLHEFQLKPSTGNDFYAPTNAQLKPVDLAALNELTGLKRAGKNESLDEALRDASVQLTNCPAWQRERLNMSELISECPMMVNATTPFNWFELHPEPRDRSRASLKCGCQLLLHNNTWLAMVEDPNVRVMSDTLTNYMKLHPLPVDKTASESALLNTREYFGWFESVLEKFITSKRVAVKEVVKFRRHSEDPTNEINAKTNDEEQALELLRLGCNRIVFNQTKRGALTRISPPTKSSDISLWKYLDNLQFISQDPLFVFHLVLQDASLFKVYALSKICEPFVK